MWMWIGIVLALGLIAMVVYDLMQRRHAILRNFPIVGHFRYWLELVGPELRQYIVTNKDEERPFSRDQRHWVYASSKLENNYFGFGSDNEMEAVDHYLIIKHRSVPPDPPPPPLPEGDRLYPIPAAKILGGHRARPSARGTGEVSDPPSGQWASSGIQAARAPGMSPYS